MTCNIVKFPGNSKLSPELAERMERGRQIDTLVPSNDLQAMMMAKLQETLAEAVPHFPIGTPKETIHHCDGERQGRRTLFDGCADRKQSRS